MSRVSLAIGSYTDSTQATTKRFAREIHTELRVLPDPQIIPLPLPMLVRCAMMPVASNTGISVYSVTEFSVRVLQHYVQI